MDTLRKLVTANQLAVIETNDEQTPCNKSESFGWKYRQFGDRLVIFMPEKYILKDVVNKFNGIPLSSISLQEIQLEHVYLEVTRG